MYFYLVSRGIRLRYLVYHLQVGCKGCYLLFCFFSCDNTTYYNTLIFSQIRLTNDHKTVMAKCHHSENYNYQMGRNFIKIYFCRTVSCCQEIKQSYFIINTSLKQITFCNTLLPSKHFNGLRQDVKNGRAWIRLFVDQDISASFKRLIICGAIKKGPFIDAQKKEVLLINPTEQVF